MNALLEMSQRDAVMPPGRSIGPCGEDDSIILVTIADEPQPIAGFVCIIEYRGSSGKLSERLITCRSFDVIGEHRLVSAVCSSANAFRQFRCDRISTISDAFTGEALGDGTFFDRFSINATRERPDNWGLTPARKAFLVAGLNVLTFMARCDGHWHFLEEGAIEDFTCDLWMRQGWEGQPPMDKILEHARRIAPDGGVFEAAIRHWARSASASRMLAHHVHRLIAADGVICDEEFEWSMRFDDSLADAKAELGVPKPAIAVRALGS